jgi:hypothetical protein
LRRCPPGAESRIIWTRLPLFQGREACAALVPLVSNVAQADWLNDPVALRDLCGTQARRALQLPAADLSARLPVDCSAQALDALDRAANGLVLVVKPGSKRLEEGGNRLLHVPDVAPGALNGLRVVVALVAAEVFCIATAWPGGPTMITFTAVGVILFSPRADSAYSSVVEYIVGATIAGGLAAILSLAILPSLHGDFLVLSLALGCVLFPLGAMSAGSWRRQTFLAMGTNFLPILAIENRPNYDGDRLLNATLTIGVGMIAAAIFLRLLPPLPPVTRTRRLLALTLRDLRRLATGGGGWKRRLGPVSFPTGSGLCRSRRHWNRRPSPSARAGRRCTRSRVRLPCPSERCGGSRMARALLCSTVRRRHGPGAKGNARGCRGRGGHSGAISHLALIPQIRAMFDGTVILAGAVSNGATIRAAEILGADLAYLGTRFIATRESLAPDAYKAMLVAGTSADVIYTQAINGLPASWLKASIRSVVPVSY